MEESAWRRHRLANGLQSLLLLAFLGAFLGLVGWLLWGREGLVSLAVTLPFLLLLNPAVNPRLLMRLYGARRLREADAPGLLATVAELARRAGLEKPPALFYIPTPLINAFSTGRRDDAVVAVSAGLLRTLTPRELAAVLAHEISHIRADDTWVMGIADLFSRLTSVFSLFGQFLLLINLPLLLVQQTPINWAAIALLIFAPTLSALAQLGLSRTREYDADLNAVQLTGDPQALASALVKVDRYNGNYLEQILLPGRGVPEPSWLRTHPPTEERIRRILALGKTASARPLPLPGSGGDAADSFLPPSARPRWHLHGLWY